MEFSEPLRKQKETDKKEKPRTVLNFAENVIQGYDGRETTPIKQGDTAQVGDGHGEAVDAV